MVGGIAGWVYESTISKSKNEAQISFLGINGISYEEGYGGGVGGIAGGVACNSTVEQCYNTSTITSKFIDGNGKMSHIGGIIGYCNSSVIKNVYNVGNIYGLDQVGGIIGLIQPEGGLTGNTYIYNSYNASEIIEGSNHIGNFVGACHNTIGAYNSAISGYTDAGYYGSNCSFNNGAVYTLAQMKEKNSELLTLLSNEEGNGIWAQDANINDGLPYLINNRPH